MVGRASYKGGEAVMTALDVISFLYAVKYLLLLMRYWILTVKVLHNEKDHPNRK